MLFFSSSIVSLTDFFPPKHESIRGKSNFSCGSDSGLLLYFAKSASLCPDLDPQNFIPKYEAAARSSKKNTGVLTGYTFFAFFPFS